MTPIDRGRRIVEAPEWPAAAGAFLCLLALAELLLGAGRSGLELSSAMLLGAAATLPLAAARTRLTAAAAVISAATVLTVATGQRPTAAGLAALLAAWYLLGRNRSRRARAEAVESDASRRVLESTLLEHAVRGQRARIARELHDIVAHHISMIAVQAETARLATPGMPAEGAARLLAIGDTARDALTEMRRLLGVLREDAGAEPTREPQPGLRQLTELVDEARDATGAGTRLIVSGPVARLPSGIEITAYRIVQEALTNARRHAPGAAVDVELGYTGDALRVRVRDSGPAPAGAPVAGHGLLGMRERVAAVGGELRAGPAPAGGFLVEALLPTTGEAR